MKQAYVGVVVLFVVGLLTSGMFLLLSHLASAYRPSVVKAMPFETIFFLPWAVIFRDLGLFGLIEMFIFIFVLAVGLAYAWKKGALEWD